MTLGLRVQSGIPGLDPLIGGGFLKNSVNLVSGKTGTGKTIFCLQFLWHGLQKGEPGVFLSLEEDPQEIRDDVRAFGWDFEKFEKKNMCVISFHDPFEISDISSMLVDNIEKIKAERVVIDSISILGSYLKDVNTIRKRMLKLIRVIKEANCTGLITSEVQEDADNLSTFGVEEFVVDGVLVLKFVGLGQEFNRSLLIRKMRRTNHGKDLYPFEIGPKGIFLGKKEEVY
jgi:KaiC/GvpD/RAD55 family RecA-like ATPase